MTETTPDKPSRTGRRRRAWLALAGVLVAALTACADDPGGARRDPAATPAAPTDAARKLGHGPADDPHVSLQPDVVKIGGGPAAIKRASNDGMQFTIAGDAPGAADLEPGKVMFASALAVGRVIAVRDNGKDLDVLLAPADLTDVIRNGDLSIDQPIDLRGAAFQAVPARPGVVRDQDAGTTPTPGEPQASAPAAGGPAPKRIVAPALRMVPPPNPYRPPAGELPDPNTGESASIKVGDWSFATSRSGGSIGVTAAYEVNGGLKFTLSLSLDMTDPRMRSDLRIRDGKAGLLESTISGIKAIRADVKAGSGNGLADNQKMLIELPVELWQFVVPVYGVPTVVKLGYKVLVTTGFSAKNSTLAANVAMKIDGDLGVASGKPSTATATPLHDALKTIRGTSLGVTGIVTAVQFEASWGLGTPNALAGPSVSLTASLGITYGSDLGIVKCRSITIKISAAASIGISVSKATAATIRKLLGNLIALGEHPGGQGAWYDAKKKAEKDGPWDPSKMSMSVSQQIGSRDLYNVTKWYPDAAVCRV